jgi:signal transduction histidine kinase
MKALSELSANIEQLVHEAEQMVDRRNAEALPLAQKAMTLALESGYPKHFAQAKYILAFYDCLVANSYDTAIELCNEALIKVDPEEIGDVSYKLYMTLGNSYQLKGDVFSAQESYLKGLKQLEAKTELTLREKGFLASFYYNVSLLLSNSELNISTEEYLQKAIKLYEETESFFKLSLSYLSYAGILEKKKEYDRAIEYLHRALELNTKSNDAYSIALTTANLGILHQHIGKFDKALPYLLDSEAYYSKNSMLYERGMVLTAIAETYYGTGRLENAIGRLHEAEEIFRTLENKSELSRVHELLSKYIEQTGDDTAALRYQKLYTESLKYFFDIEKTNALTRAKKEFENEQKEKETQLLQEKNEEIKKYVYRLENSNNELKQFAHVASHDLREPLRMITAYMGLVEKSLSQNITPQQKEFIAFAIDGAKRMEGLILGVLHLARVDSNPKVERVKLQNVADEIRLNLDMLLQDKKASIVYYDLPEISADRTQMLQMMQNIVSNGIKYNESENPVVKIKYTRRQNEIELTIADNGIGIPEIYRERVFQIFQRIETTKTYSGTGIGLAVCKKIVDRMNGKITIEDNPGGGTIFRLTLPASILFAGQ